LRQLHYAIFSRKEIPYENTQADYKRLSRATTVARRAYRAWELETGGPGTPPAYSIPPDQDAKEHVEAIKRSYRRDNWQDQPNYCEVWSEKATILGATRPVADRWGITLRVCHGFGSTGMEEQVERGDVILILVPIARSNPTAFQSVITFRRASRVEQMCPLACDQGRGSYSHISPGIGCRSAGG
jgi:hypothetical protein